MNPASRALEIRRRELEEKERSLAAEQTRLRREIGTPEPVPAPEPVLLPVWRQEQEEPFTRSAEPTPARRRALAGQRRREQIFFALGLFLLLLAVWLITWLSRTHAPTG